MRIPTALLCSGVLRETGLQIISFKKKERQIFWLFPSNQVCHPKVSNFPQRAQTQSHTGIFPSEISTRADSKRGTNKTNKIQNIVNILIVSLGTTLICSPHSLTNHKLRILLLWAKFHCPMTLWNCFEADRSAQQNVRETLPPALH